MIDSIANDFEKKVLFGAGRHIWNFCAIAGIIAVSIGGATYITSNDKPILEFVDWLKQEKSGDDPTVREIVTQMPLIESAKEDCNYAKEYGNDYDQRSRCQFYEDKRKRMENIFRGQPVIELQEEYIEYKEPLETYNDTMFATRTFASLVIRVGLITIASAAVLSAILAIERNTRKV